MPARAKRLLCLALPALVLAFSMSGMADKVLNILYVAIGLGLVIFFHELGHFAVAKWCDVLVERFSIGFGPILWSRKWGETEYAFSAIPFGGYVKMLGQDDIDPSQLTSDEIAQDPRSYSAKPVWQRMAIISAGVTMNILTAVLFFAAAYGIGVTQKQPVIGFVSAGGPAWTAGIRMGDRITEMNGREVRTFRDIIRGVVLSSGDIPIKGTHANGETFAISVNPDASGTRRKIGVIFSHSAVVAELEGDASPLITGTPAAEGEQRLQSGDRIVAVGNVEISSNAELHEAFARHRDETVILTVRRAVDAKESETADAKTVKIPIGPNPTRTLGLRVEIGEIESVVAGSPADRAGIKPGDQITRIDGQDVGGALDPMRLPYYFSDKAGQEVKVTVQRNAKSGAPKNLTFTLTPEDRPGWIERPSLAGIPLSVPAIGIAYHLSPRVLSVVPGGPAAKAGLEKADTIESISFVLPEDEELGMGADKRKITIPMVKTVEDVTNKNYAYAFEMMQRFPRRYALVTIRGQDEPVRVNPWSNPDDTWYMPTRGFYTQFLTKKFHAAGFVEAMRLGGRHTVNTVIDLYLTLRNLVTGRLSLKELRGPFGIAEIAYKISQNGTAKLLQFLGYLSVNLAVLNFLPIPVLDGGHMVFLIWEGVTRRKPSERAVQVATMVGLAFILMLMLTVIYMDLFVHKVFQGS